MDSKMSPDFKPQRELIYNKYLPYSDVLENEANAQLSEIKKNLSLAVQLRDINKGAVFWSSKLYG